jgi:hypothetical protein
MRDGIFAFELVGLIVCGTVTNVASMAMKLKVNSLLPNEERFSWWSQNFSEVGRKYLELFPGSMVPNITRYSRWACLALLLAMIVSGFVQN